MSPANRINEVANNVVREALAASPFTQVDLGRKLGITQGALSVRLRSGYAWSLGELVVVGAFLGKDLLREISERVKTQQQKRAA